MAYQSATSTSPNQPSMVTQTMAYSSSNVTGVAGSVRGIPRFWVYASTHAATDLSAAAGFITDAQALGFKVGDILTAFTSTGAVINYRATTISATGMTLGTGTVIGTTV